MKLYDNKINLDKLFGDNCKLSCEQKKFFRALAKAFESRQDEVFSIIERNTVSALNENRDCLPIVTTITDNSSTTGFYPVLPQEEHKDNIVFIDDYIENIQEKYEFECCDNKFQLERTNIFIEKEKLLANMFRTYNIRLPYCYSPYARRAFFINIWNEQTNEYVPYDYKRNDLRSSICAERKDIIFGELYWNVEETSVEKKLRPKEVPCTNGISYVRFENSDENTYICTSALNDSVRVERSTGQKYIDVLKEDYENYLPHLIQIKIHNVDVKGGFSNIYDRIIPVPIRAITKADVALLVKKFYPKPEEYIGIESFTKEYDKEKTISDYSGKYKYNYQELFVKSKKHLNYCYLSFRDSGFDKYFVDRVNFFISFMRYCYPNFYWVGVLK